MKNKNLVKRWMGLWLKRDKLRNRKIALGYLPGSKMWIIVKPEDTERGN